MVEVLKGSVIRVQSEMNPWMGCIFVVQDIHRVRAVEVLRRAWDSFWEKGHEDGWCYGDWLEAKMKKAGIEYEVYYSKEEE